MLRVGLTGGIGAGKSTVAGRLRELGAVVVDADLLARRVVEPGTEGLAAVVDAFGPQRARPPDGALDRPALGRLVFADEAARGRLNAILHPRIAALTAREVAAAPADAVVVHDVPLLVENGLGAELPAGARRRRPGEERVRRLVGDRGMEPDDARARIAAQAGDDARRAAADVLLDNGGPPGRGARGGRRAVARPAGAVRGEPARGAAGAAARPAGARRPGPAWPAQAGACWPGCAGSPGRGRCGSTTSARPRCRAARQGRARPAGRRARPRRGRRAGGRPGRGGAGRRDGDWSDSAADGRRDARRRSPRTPTPAGR